MERNNQVLMGEVKGKVYYVFGLEDLILLRFQFPPNHQVDLK